MRWRLCFSLIALLASVTVNAAISSSPNVIVILDDLGYRETDLNALSLPNEVTFSILPQTPLSKIIAEKSHLQGRSVMLHMPMQSTSGKKMGPLGLSTNMPAGAMTHTFRVALKSVPNVIGVNNHMGSAFTVEENAMQTIMQELKRQNLFFIDSRTTIDTKAGKVAEAVGVAHASRHVFLDNHRSTVELLKQFTLAKTFAKRHGTVIIIAHPYPETLRFLALHLPKLAEEGITLSSVADYFSPSSNLLAPSFSQNLPSMAQAPPND